MALPLLAALPLLFEGVKTATELFTAGRATVASVTGKPSTATDAAGLIAEVEAMPPEQQAQWAEAQQAATDQYEAETERLLAEQGAVDASTLGMLPPRVAGKVAWLRMATRPRIVLRMSHVVLLPVYVFAIDGTLITVNVLLRPFTGVQFDPIAGELFSAGSLYVELYKFAAPTAASVIVSYFGLREYGKAKNGEPGLGSAIGKAAGLIRRIIKR